MKTKLTKVECRLTDCIYYVEKPGEPGVSYCKHPEIAFYKTNHRCPLYRLDWLKKMESLEGSNKPTEH